MMLRPAMSNKQIQLWGELFVVVSKQLNALHDLTNGQLDFFGKLGIKLRNKVIFKSIYQVERAYTKALTNKSMVAGNIATDLDEISNGTTAVGTIDEKQMRYVCRILESYPFS